MQLIMILEESMLRILWLLVFVVITGLMFAQMVPVEIVNEAEDSTGRLLVTKFRDVIRSSPSYTITYASDEPHFKIKIDTMDRWKGDPENEGFSTIYNYTILLSYDGLDKYCYNQLGYAGRDTLDRIAYSFYSDLDEFIEAFLAILVNYLEE